MELIDGFTFSNKTLNYNITKAELNQNTLSIIVSYGGGCEIHEWALKGPTDFLKSLPPKKDYSLSIILMGIGVEKL